MGLKQDIVVVNEFSMKTGSKGGTRGGTPGDYVLRYMARKGATEELTPVRLEDQDAYVTRYMARREATEVFDTVSGVKQGMRSAQGLGGVAFGSTGRDDLGDMSMSDRKIRRVSKDIQKQFDEGKTVLKTVLSFDTEYLRKMGVVDAGFEPRNRGDFRGNIDQMKLRLAVMDGMRKLGRKFDDLEWCGVIQVDTMHVHCHLCMVDKGVGKLMPDGTQRGKLNEGEKRVLRRGVDMSLDEMHPVKMLSSNVAYDKRNARCFIKKFTHETMASHGLPQLLLACLPEDRRLWRASTNRREMQKPNAIVREYVEQVLAQPDSGYDKAMRDISAYAEERRSREDLTGEQYRRLVAQGRERLMDDCVNGVYAMLKTIPKERMRTRTPMLDVMSMEYREMASEAVGDPMMEFGFKLRSYSSRLEHHRKERRRYRDARKQYEDAESRGQVSEESKPLKEFYEVEEQYNAMLMAKYQHFLSFLPPEEEYRDAFDEIMEYRDRIRRMDLMLQDKGMARRSPESAEDYGRRVYDLHGGRYMVTAPQVLENRLDRMLDTYEAKVDEFQVDLSERGMVFEADEHSAHVARSPAYPFDMVKALDLHHLGYDFPFEAEVSKVNVDAFVEMSRRRFEAYEGAAAYLENSGQGDYVAELPGTDVYLMKEMADRLAEQPVLRSMKGSPSGRRGRGRTISLDQDFDRDMRLAVQATVASMQAGE